MKLCIDAGHGGHDSGAVGSNGLAEAPTNLTICQELGAICEGALGWDVRLTRHSDVFVSLDARAEAANEWDADWFVSIHCNSNGPDAHGIETLYKSDEGKDIASYVQSALIKATDERDRGLKYRDNLAVLNLTEMAAILVEVGFISHPATERKLLNPEYLLLLANAIAKGLKEAL